MASMQFRQITSDTWTTVLLLAICTFTVIDLILDWTHQVSFAHMLNQGALVACSLGVVVYLRTRWHRAQLEAQAADHRSQRVLQGLGCAIDEQLRQWGLSEAERTTAMLLLKGLSHKDIAQVTGRSERTVRQHAVVVYRKSGQAGRAELSAFFIESLLPPIEVHAGVGRFSGTAKKMGEGCEQGRGAA